MSLHKSHREAEEDEGEERRVTGRAAAVGDGEEKESGDQTAAEADGSMQSDGKEKESIAAAATLPSASSRLLPPRADLPECELCRLPLQSADEQSGLSAGAGRLPRLLPCGHCYCSKCIEKMLQRSGK